MDIVMFGFNDWRQWEEEGFCTRSGAYARELSRHPGVGTMLVVSTPSSIAMRTVRRLRSDRSKPPVRRGVSGIRGLSQVADRVYAFDHTRLMPRENTYGPLYRINGAVHDSHLRAALRESADALGMGHARVLWVSNPLMAKHMGHLGERVAVFDADDDWSAHPQKTHIRAAIEQGYEQAIERADLIFACSEGLAEKFGSRRNGVSWQPNGVDMALFDRPATVPADVASLPRPLIGYVGVMQERLDVETIRHLARSIPQASIVLVGPVVTPQHFASISEKNVHFVGERPHELVPAYLSAFDVCIMPHADSELTRSMNPLKLYEYLAAGKPVVVSGLAGFGELDGLIARAESPRAFAAAVSAALSPGEDRVVRARRAYAEAHSWEARADEMVAAVEQRLAGRDDVSRGAA